MPLRIVSFSASQGFKRITKIKQIQKTPHLPGRWLGVRGFGGVVVCPALPALGETEEHTTTAHHHTPQPPHAQSPARPASAQGGEVFL